MPRPWSRNKGVLLKSTAGASGSPESCPTCSLLGLVMQLMLRPGLSVPFSLFPQTHQEKASVGMGTGVEPGSQPGV